MAQSIPRVHISPIPHLTGITGKYNFDGVPGRASAGYFITRDQAFFFLFFFQGKGEKIRMLDTLLRESSAAL